MAFTNYVPPILNPSQSGALPDLIGNLLSGYGDVYKARMLPQDLIKKQLENKWYEPNIKSQIGLRGAQSGHLGAMTEGLNISNPFLRQKLEQEQSKRQFELKNPFFGQTGTSGDLGRLLYLQEMIKNHPEFANQINPDQQKNIPDENQSFIPSISNNQIPTTQPKNNNFDYNKLIQNAFKKVSEGKNQQFAPSNLGKLQQEYEKAKSGYNPFTGQKFETEQDKEDFIAPYAEKLSGLKQGEHYLYDPENHEKIGIQRPFTPQEREKETGRAFFNEVFPTINNGFKDFIGKDSAKNFLKYANHYGKDPNATRKIDDLLLAQKLTSAAVVNEAATLGAGKTNMTYRNLSKSFPNSDVHHLIQKYGNELKLPSDAFVKAGLRFQNILNHATEKSSNSIPPLKTIHYHPEKYLKSDEEKKSALEHHHETIIVVNKKTGEKKEVSKAEARKLGVPNV